MPQTPEHIAKRVASRLANGNYKAPHFTTLNKSRAGIPLSAAQKKKQSETNKGKQFALGTVRSEEFRRKLSNYWAANREKHNHYVDGKGAERNSERQVAMARLDYRLWREAVFSRDDWTCQHCGVRGVTIHADHIKPWAKYPDLRYDVTNGRTLCVPCHKKTPTYAGRMHSVEDVLECL